MFFASNKIRVWIDYGVGEEQYKFTKVSVHSVGKFGSLFFERVRFGITVASMNMQVNFDEDDLYTWRDRRLLLIVGVYRTVLIEFASAKQSWHVFELLATSKVLHASEGKLRRDTGPVVAGNVIRVNTRPGFRYVHGASRNP
jgi:hypothetical protein